MWRAMEKKATSIAGMLAEAQETRRQWEALTEPTRRMAIAADLELRRRHPDTALAPLRSAEPTAIPGPGPEPESARREVWVQDTLDGAAHLARESPAADRDAESEPGAPGRSDARGQQALGLTPSAAHEEIPEQVHRIRENARKAQAEIDRLRGTPQYAEDDDAVYLGAAWGNLIRRDRDAILQPPKPGIVPASAVLQQAGHRGADIEPEAG